MKKQENSATKLRYKYFFLYLVDKRQLEMLKWQLHFSTTRGVSPFCSQHALCLRWEKTASGSLHSKDDSRCPPGAFYDTKQKPVSPGGFCCLFRWSWQQTGGRNRKRKHSTAGGSNVHSQSRSGQKLKCRSGPSEFQFLQGNQKNSPSVLFCEDWLVVTLVPRSPWTPRVCRLLADAVFYVK